MYSIYQKSTVDKGGVIKSKNMGLFEDVESSSAVCISTLSLDITKLGAICSQWKSALEKIY